MMDSNQDKNSIFSKYFPDALDERFGELKILLTESEKKEYDMIDQKARQDVFDLSEAGIERSSRIKGI